MHWSVCQDFKIAVRVIDGEYLVYFGGNGDTHRLGLEAGFVFGLLWNCINPMNMESLVSEVKQSGFTDLDSDSLGEILNGLCALHLVKYS